MTHRELYLHGLAAQIGLGFTEDDVVLHVVPLFHVNGWGTPHFLTMVGGRHVMLRKFDPTALMSLVERHRVTRLLAVPTIFNAVLNSRERPRFDLSSLRQLIIGGSPSSPELIRALESEIGAQAIVGYGLTETSPIITLAQPRRVLTDSEPAERRQERQSMTGWAIPGVSDPGRRRGRRRRPARWRADRRDRRPRQHRDGRLLPRPRGDRGDDPRRLAPHRRHGHHRRRGLHPDQGPLEGHHHQRRREHLVGRDRGRARLPTRPSWSAPSSPRRIHKRGEVPVAIVVRKPDTDATAKELRALLPRAPRRAQGPQGDPFPRRPPKGGTGKILKAELREPFWVGHDARVG